MQLYPLFIPHLHVPVRSEYALLLGSHVASRGTMKVKQVYGSVVADTRLVYCMAAPEREEMPKDTPEPPGPACMPYCGEGARGGIGPPTLMDVRQSGCLLL